MPAIVSIVGKSKSGKTALIEKLIRELKSRGYKVATIKHAMGELALDKQGKDSWRHIQAGSEATAISSQEEFVLIKPMTERLNLEEMTRIFGGDYDIILTEGFKQGNAPKIEVHRKDVGPPFGSLKKRIAIVTDEPLETKVRQFSLENIEGLADLLEKGFIKPQKERISVYVNKALIPLTTFASKIISNVIVAMVSCLKGVEKTGSIEIFLKKEPESHSTHQQ
jgi:molybdopterin-guanine dinucleotide biosynthesis protein B